MGDEFRIPPAERREPKQFEPPPWERDAFEELASRRKEQAEEPTAEAPDAGSSEEPREPAGETPQPQPAAPAEKPAEGGSAKPQLDEDQVNAMLAALAASDKSSTAWQMNVTIGAALLSGGLGAAMIVWGTAGLVKARVAGSTATIAGLGLMFFGALFVGVAVWVVAKQLRQRGVL